MYEHDPSYLPPPQRPGMGCVAKGCLTLLVVGVLMGVMVGALSWYTVRGFLPFLDQSAASIRVLTATDEQYQATAEKLTPFVQSVNAGHAGTLTLSADDFNILVARDPAWADLRGKLFLSLEAGKIVAETSFPVNEDTADGAQRLYFKGRVTFDASFADGDFTLVLRGVTPLGGGPTPALAAWVFGHPNMSRAVSTGLNDRFHETIRRNPAQAAFFNRVRTIIVKGDQIVITAAESPPAVAAPANPP